MNRDALLVLADGTKFEGEAIGARRRRRTTGEVVFNTALSGYQEIVTDPSYAGQVITFTYPHIGNYGVNADDDESRRPFCSGRGGARPRRAHSNWRATERRSTTCSCATASPGITGIDTRRLTRHLRDEGALPGAFGTDEAAVRAAAASATHAPTASTSSPPSPPTSPTSSAATTRAVPRRRLRLRHQAHDPAPPRRRRAAAVEVVPATTTAADVLAREPDGVFLSNGPGDPAAVDRRGRRRCGA